MSMSLVCMKAVRSIYASHTDNLNCCAFRRTLHEDVHELKCLALVEGTDKISSKL